MYFFKKTTNKHTEKNTAKNLFNNVTGGHKHKQDCNLLCLSHFKEGK